MNRLGEEQAITWRDYMTLRGLFSFVGVVGTSLILWTLISWRFEDVARKDLYNFLDNNPDLVTVNRDSIKFHEYQLFVELDDVTLFPNDPIFRMHTDKLLVRFNPLSSRYRFVTQGKIWSSGSGDFETYVPNPRYELAFDRGIAFGDFEQFKFELLTKKSDIFSAKTDKIIESFDNFELRLSNTEEEDDRTMHKIRFTHQVNLIKRSDSQFKYFSMMMDAIAAEPKYEWITSNPIFESVKEQIDIHRKIESDPKAIEIYEKMDKKRPYTKYQTFYSLRVEKDLVLRFIDSLKTSSFANFVSGIDFKQLKFDTKSSYRVTNRSIFSAVSADGSNDNGIMKFNANYHFVNQLDEDQSEALLSFPTVMRPYFEELMYSKAKRDYSEKIAQDSDFEQQVRKDVNQSSEFFYDMSNSILGSMLSLDNSYISFNIEYDNNLSEFKHKTRLSFNKEEIEFKGGNKQKGDGYEYNATLYISNPSDLVKILPDTYDDHFKLLCEKYVGDEYSVGINGFFDNIRTHGYPVLQALHYKNKLREGDDLYTYLKIVSPKPTEGFPEFFINEKDVFTTLSDERITIFLQNLGLDTSYLQSYFPDKDS